MSATNLLLLLCVISMVEFEPIFGMDSIDDLPIKYAEGTFTLLAHGGANIKTYELKHIPEYTDIYVVCEDNERIHLSDVVEYSTPNSADGEVYCANLTEFCTYEHMCNCGPKLNPQYLCIKNIPGGLSENTINHCKEQNGKCIVRVNRIDFTDEPCNPFGSGGECTWSGWIGASNWCFSRWATLSYKCVPNIVETTTTTTTTLPTTTEEIPETTSTPIITPPSNVHSVDTSFPMQGSCHDDCSKGYTYYLEDQPKMVPVTMHCGAEESVKIYDVVEYSATNSDDYKVFCPTLNNNCTYENRCDCGPKPGEENLCIENVPGYISADDISRCEMTRGDCQIMLPIFDFNDSTCRPTGKFRCWSGGLFNRCFSRWATVTYECGEPKQGTIPPPERKTVAFLIDVSSDVSSDVYDYERIFTMLVMDDLVNRTTIHDDLFNLAVIAFSREAKTVWTFEQEVDVPTITTELISKPEIEDGRRTDLALGQLEEMVDKFEENNISCLILTTGRSDQPNVTRTALESLTEKGVRFYTIGIGPDFPSDEWPETDSSHVYTVRDFRFLFMLLDEIAEKLYSV